MILHCQAKKVFSLRWIIIEEIKYLNQIICIENCDLSDIKDDL